MIVERYNVWTNKVSRNATCTKGVVGFAVTEAFAAAGPVGADALSMRRHVARLARGLEGVCEQHKNHRWLAKLTQEVKAWAEVAETVLSSNGCHVDRLVEAVLEDELSIDEAVDLLR